MTPTATDEDHPYHKPERKQSEVYELSELRKYHISVDGESIAKVATRKVSSRLAMNLGPPPAHADKQETPILKELRLFALKRVADKLKHPSHNKQPKCIKPQAVNEDTSEEQGERNEN